MVIKFETEYLLSLARSFVVVRFMVLLRNIARAAERIRKGKWAFCHPHKKSECDHNLRRQTDYLEALSALCHHHRAH